MNKRKLLRPQDSFPKHIWMEYTTALEQQLAEKDKEMRHYLAHAYDAAYSEYMNCPWCSGHIGHENNEHDDHCPVKLYGLIEQGQKGDCG